MTDRLSVCLVVVACLSHIDYQIPSSIAADKAFWTVFYANGDQSMIHDLGGNRMGITIGPWKESVGVQSESMTD